jgi:3-methyladenine DNA glycosylase AlkD
MKWSYPPLTFEEALHSLLQLADPNIIASQERVGITPARLLGVSLPTIRKLGRGQKNHKLAQQLWESRYHEARILATIVDEIEQVNRYQMEMWASEFDSWDICDLAIINLFHRSAFAVDCSLDWIHHKPEFFCRAGFVLMAVMAVHRKDFIDEQFLPFIQLIFDHTFDNRVYVNKAISWALRQIGKRSPFLRHHALEVALSLKRQHSSAAQRVGADAQKVLATIQC